MLSRDYNKFPLVGREIPCYEDIQYLYIGLNWCFTKITKYFNKTGSWSNRIIRKYGLIKSKNMEIQSKKDYCLETLGVENPAQLQVSKDQIRKTNLVKYGVTNVSQLKEVEQKKQITRKRDKGRKLNIIIPEDTIKKEFKRIQHGVDNGYKTSYSWNEIVLYFQWKEFYKKEIELWNENKMYHGLPLQSWIYLNRLKYIHKGAQELTDREILRAFKISGIHIGNSFHSPFYIQQFIKDYDIKSILDPCGGWGHRILGASNITYIYNDINPITCNNCKRMCDYFRLDNKYFYNEDSQHLSVKENYDAVFTCPPYFDKEIYSEHGIENKSYEQFLTWWENTIIQSLKGNPKYFAFIINHIYKTDMENICLKYMNKIDEITLGKQNYSHLNAHNRNSGTKGEFLLIFTR